MSATVGYSKSVQLKNVFFSIFLVDIEEEKNLVVQALRLNTLSKLTFSDCKRFDALIQDVFPGINFQDVEYTTLREALRGAMKELGLVESKVQVKKLIQSFP